jgi:hypothetical protein
MAASALAMFVLLLLLWGLKWLMERFQIGCFRRMQGPGQHPSAGSAPRQAGDVEVIILKKKIINFNTT